MSSTRSTPSPSASSGDGSSTVGGTRLDWSEGDIFVIPSWLPAAHWSDSGADLFELSDAPVLRALGLYREEVGE